MRNARLNYGELSKAYVFDEMEEPLTFSINAGECVENWTEIVCSYPPRIELWTLDEKLKDNKKECVKAVLYIIILKYSLYSKLPCCIRFIQTGL